MIYQKRYNDILENIENDLALTAMKYPGINNVDIAVTIQNAEIVFLKSEDSCYYLQRLLLIVEFCFFCRM